LNGIHITGFGRLDPTAGLCTERVNGAKMSLSFVDDLQAQVEQLEKQILEAEAAGNDSGGDRVALSHLKALLEHFRGKLNKSPT